MDKMKLFYSPGACSMASHIVLNEIGAQFEIEPVNLQTHHFKGGDFYKFNAKGYVPALQLGNGELLTEGAAILQYLADQKPEAKLAPANGVFERYRFQEWLNFISTEIHKNFSPLWNKSLAPEARTKAEEHLSKRLEVVATHLKNHKFLMGDNYTVADAYLFTVLSWSPMVQFNIAKWPVFSGYLERISSRPAVQKTLVAEGLVKTKAS